MMNTVITEVIQQMENLPTSLQWRVLEFVKNLTASRRQGVSGDKLVRFAGVIPPDDLEVMSRAIEQDCEQVDMNEW